MIRSTLFRQWRWQSSSMICNITQISVTDKGTCSCLISNGTFAITSDMFDPDVNVFFKEFLLFIPLIFI